MADNELEMKYASFLAQERSMALGLLRPSAGALCHCRLVYRPEREPRELPRASEWAVETR